METTLVADYDLVPAPDGTCAGYVVRALLTLSADPGTEPGRAALNLSLVLDRSGSMSGEPLHAARRAAAMLVRRLRPEDVVSVVAYADQVSTVAEPATGDAQRALPREIEQIETGGSTNLSGGWLRGRELVGRTLSAQRIAQADAGGMHRVLLLTDGLANAGITDPATLIGMCRAAREQGITTTTIGFGEGYDEALLRAMADAGGGSTYYIERPDQAADVFGEEIDGLLSLAAQNVAVDMRAADAVRLVRVHHDYPTAPHANGARVELGDLYAREPRALLVELFVPLPPGEVPGAWAPPAVGELVVHAHVVLPDGGIERQEIRLPVAPTLGATGVAEPTIVRERVLLQAAAARNAALRAREAGDFQQGAHLLAEAALAAAPYVGSDLRVAEEVEDLEAMASHFAEERVTAADAKYLAQMAYAQNRGKEGTRATLRRRPPPRA
ncbi:vWA domain-containing protein [Roseisolibacter agri]|uniref:VWFA domain-containing protein n=1 Tax=Roseisolibacter agri TaxID=2014610 RepID=A0AA37V8G7_9BACT|nr:VWA domain-containing protein [Roseisolibacter agri]GLC27761.1 hypothetical protein rosag_42740 [Roseisolibacter agri]